MPDATSPEDPSSKPAIDLESTSVSTSVSAGGNGEASPRFSHILHRLRHEAKEPEIESRGLTLFRLVEIFGPKGHVLLTVFLVLPFLQPIPLPGISTPIGITIGMVGFYLILGRPPWLPKRLARIRLPVPALLRICTLLERWTVRAERYIRPRGRGLFSAPGLRSGTGVTMIILALLLSLPLPVPFSNTLPAVALLLLSIATLEEDAVLFGLACVAVVGNVAFFVTLALLPYLGVQWLRT